MICIWATEWREGKTTQPYEVVDEAKNQSRLEFHILKSDILEYWRLVEHFPWESYARFRDGQLVNESRFISLAQEASQVSLPVIVTEELFHELLHPAGISEICPVSYHNTPGCIELFLLAKQDVYIDRALSVSLGDQHISPVIPSVTCLDPTIQRKRGGVIISDFCSYTTSIVLGFFARGATTMLAISQPSDHHTVFQLKKLYPKITLWWEAKDIIEHEYPTHVIMNYKLWNEFGRVATSRQWNHVILDECYVDSVFNCHCLWIIDIDVTKLSMNKWLEMYQLPELLGVPLSDFAHDDVFSMFVFYNVIYKGRKKHDKIDLQLSNRFIRFTDDYPAIWISKALRRDDLDPHELCLHLLDIESHERFELFHFLRYFSNNRYTMPSYQSLTQVTEFEEKECCVCHDEEATGFVMNEACRHVLCYACAYIVNILYQKCPLCRVEYGETFVRGEVELNNFREPVSWKSPTKGRFRELIYLVRKTHTQGRIVICSGLSYSYLHYIEDVLHMSFPNLVMVVCDKWNMTMIHMADVILIHHRDLSYLRHYPGIHTLIAMDLDMSKCITRCMYHYFKNCQHKYVIAPAHGITEAIVNNMEWYNEYELLAVL